MSKFRYKNISDQEQNVVGFGVVKAGQVIETDLPIDNPNFETTSKSEQKRVGVMQEDRVVGLDPVTPIPKGEDK